MDCTVHGILQARIPKWVAVSFFRGSSQPRDWIQVSLIAGGFFTSWATREALCPLKLQISHSPWSHVSFLIHGPVPLKSPIAYANFCSLSIFHLLLLSYFFMVVISPVVLIKYTYTYIDVCVRCVHTYLLSWYLSVGIVSFAFCMMELKVMVRREGYFIAVRVLVLIIFTTECTFIHCS